MTYYETAEDVIITRARAVQELRRHGITDTTEFDSDMGICAEYNAQAVLQWLGY